MTEPVLNAILVGGGPAGTAMLTAASKHGRLAPLARAGLAIVERDEAIGIGRLGRYAITSDSTAETFLSAVKDNPHPEIAALADGPAARAIGGYVGKLGVPLVEAGPLIRDTGDALDRIVRAEGGEVLTGHEAIAAERTAAGHWRVHLRRLADGAPLTRLARRLVVAAGGHQPAARLADETVAGASLLGIAGDRLVQSDELLELGGVEGHAARLTGKPDPRIVVLGGSTSALSAATLFLKSGLPFGDGGVTVLHRRPLRPFYHSAEAALAEGFTDFTADDICPVSGFVYRLAGFRLESRELLLCQRGIGGRAPDPRLRLKRFAEGFDPEALEIVAAADLVVAALGYRPHALPLLEADGAPIALKAHGRGRPPLVDRDCRIVAANGRPLPDAYAIGLAAGFVPWGRLGGEASFSGQANGLWLWQNDVGLMIVDQLLAERARAVA